MAKNIEIEYIKNMNLHLINEINYMSKKLESCETSQFEKMLICGKSCERQSLLIEAIQWYEQIVIMMEDACLINNCYKETLGRLALNQLRLNLYKQGLITAKKLVDIDESFIIKIGKGNVSSLTILGEAMLLNNFIDEALEVLEAAIRLCPDDEYSVYHLNSLYLELGMIDKKEEIIKKITFVLKNIKLDLKIKTL